MENHSSETIYCCFCDKDLSPGSQSGTNSIVKYRCPACERTYCRANCFAGHKERFTCPGVRNTTPYVSLSKFDEKQFLDDYFFLEKVNERIESARRVLPGIKKEKLINNISKKNKKNRRSKAKNKTENH